MRVIDIFRADKSDVSWGDWKSTRMPPGAFPLSKGKKNSYRLGSAYRWNTCKFNVGSHKFRLLVAYRKDVDEFLSMLGMVVGDDTRMVAELCYHGSHPGWHCHADCGDVLGNPIGVMRWPGYRRRPRARSFHRNVAFTGSGAQIDDGAARLIAEDWYRIGSAGFFSRRKRW